MKTENLLIYVNTGKDKAYNQYAAYVVAFMAKKFAKIKSKKHGVKSLSLTVNPF